jgi:hypothetical protein
LRREKLQSEGNFFESGKKDGILWARSAHYDDIQYALHWPVAENAGKDDILGGYFQEKFTLNRLGEQYTYFNKEYLLNYLKGWKQGVEQFWAEIKERL